MEKLKISLNGECPCNSGKKYKKCCMGKLSEEQEEYFGFLQYFNRIKNKLIEWFWFELEDSERDYYVRQFGVENVEIIKKQENPAEFFEWFFHQAKEIKTKENILKVIIERRPYILAPDELLVLREKLKNTQAGVFEVLSSDEKTWEIVLKECDTNKVYEVMDRLGSLDSAIGDIILTRVEKIFSRYFLCGFGKSFPRRSLNELLSFIKNSYENKKKEALSLKYEEFMNSNLRELMAFKPKSIKFIANDGEELKACEGEFKISGEKIPRLLDYFSKNQDFIILEVDKKNKKYSANVVLKRTNPKVSCREDGQMLTSFVVSPMGEKIEYSGSIDIKGDKIKVFSQSERTYRNIIDKINNVINNKLTIIKEEFETPEEILKNVDSENNDESNDEEIGPKNELAKEFLTNYYKKWCNEEIPALNNKTPRKAIKTEEGKRLLKELLIDIKNMDEHKRKSGEIDFSAEQIIRDELKFYD